MLVLDIIHRRRKMKLKKSIYIFIAGLIVLSFLSTVLPVLAQVQEDTSGCCQFEGDEPGCWYPSYPGPCANLEGKFLEGDKKCSMETGYCSSYKKDGESSSGSGK